MSTLEAPVLAITAEQRAVLVEIAYRVALQRAEQVGDCLEYRTTKGLRPPEGRYGKLRLQTGEMVGTHRLAYEAHHGPVDSDLVVRHQCDNPPCMHIGHLTIGTPRDNMQDAIDRNRWRPTRGDRNNRSSMTVETVRELRRLHEVEGWSYPRLAEHFGISRTSAVSIGCRQRWAWVQ